MTYSAFFLGDLVVTYFIGTRLRQSQPFRKTAGQLVSVLVFLMVFLMGLRMGMNEEVISSLGSIGLMALAVSLIVWIVPILGIILMRRPLNLRRQSRNTQSLHKSHGSSTSENGSERLFTAVIIIATTAGMTIGFFLILPYLDGGTLEHLDGLLNRGILSLLALMLACIGYDMGIEGTAPGHIRRAGLRVLVIPVVILIGTIAAGVLTGLIMPHLTIRESLAISFGFGWYTLAPGVITAAGHEIAGAVSFMHNVIREVGGLVLIPFVAKHIGDVEAASLPGISIMDVALPVLIRSGRSDIIAYAFAIGIPEYLYTTALVPLFIGG